MKTNHFKLLLLSVSICIAAKNHVLSQNFLSPDQLRADFGLFRQALKEAHPGLYRYNSESHMDSLFLRTEANLVHEMTQQEFYRLLIPLVSEVKCGHTKFHPDHNWTDNYFYGQDKVFPFKLFIRDRQAFILDGYDPEIHSPRGMELISINGHLVTDIIGKLLSAFFSDGNNTTFKYIEMGRFFSAYYANLFEAPDSFSLMCRQGTDLISMKVPSISRTVIDAYEKQQALQNPHKAPYSLEFHADKVALMTVSSFWMNREDIGFRKFLRKSFAEISDKEIQHLIIDLRDNEGGQDVRGARLLSYLMDRKFRYYDRLEATTDKKYSFARQARLPRFYGIQRILVSKTDSGTYLWKHSRNLKVQRAQRNAYSGKVYVLINGASFSVTSEFASVAHYLKRAVFVGEETGGGYYGNNSGTFVIVMLPNSRLNVGIPMLAYYTAVKNYPWPDRGIMPDYEVKPTLQDILLGRDAVLEFTEQMIATDSK